MAKYIIKYIKNKQVIKVELVKTKQEAIKKKKQYLQQFHITQKVKEGRQATIEKA